VRRHGVAQRGKEGVRRELRAEVVRLMRTVTQGGASASDRPALGIDRSTEPVLGRWRINRAISKKFALRLIQAESTTNLSTNFHLKVQRLQGLKDGLHQLSTYQQESHMMRT
jgi:hypothetical protein